MYTKIYRKILNCYGKRIHTDVTRILFNQYYDATHKKRIRSSRLYWSGFGILVIGFTYASVPLYRIFCQVILLFFFIVISLYIFYILILCENYIYYMRMNYLFNSRIIMVEHYLPIMITPKYNL